MAVIAFTLNGSQYQLASDVVESRLAGVVPEPVREHAVQVNGVWYPVRQAFEVGLDVPRLDFNTQTARRHLAALGFPVRGEVQPRSAESRPTSGPNPDRTGKPAPERTTARHLVSEEWHTEASVQAAVVTALASHGYRVLSVANTATRERGVDVIASRDSQTVGVEVKGYPSRNYADSARAAEPKRTPPSVQTGHWFASAVLAAMRLRTKEPEWNSVIALPDFRRYRNLFDETSGSLSAAGITVWWVAENGTVDLGE